MKVYKDATEGFYIQENIPKLKASRRESFVEWVFNLRAVTILCILYSSTALIVCVFLQFD